MFKRLKDVPECLGNINGVDYEADIQVRVTTNEKLRQDVIKILEKGPKTISLDKTYKVIKITSYGDPFDVTIINDLGEEEEFGEWFFEDIN
ncbi:MAG: hypothetical protein IKB64_10620 [Paludibacteraceae bacterium]|nr:hypothetical protein [Paludibacteraceae bacterium]